MKKCVNIPHAVGGSGSSDTELRHYAEVEDKYKNLQHSAAEVNAYLGKTKEGGKKVLKNYGYSDKDIEQLNKEKLLCELSNQKLTSYQKKAYDRMGSVRRA